MTSGGGSLATGGGGGAGSSTSGGATPAVNANGAPLLGDSRDAFRPATADIPTDPGVYKWRDAQGRVIYVGKAKNLRNRLTNYFQPLDQMHPRTQTMVLTARSLEWTVVGTELEALTLEYTWIKEFEPRFNVVFRDDKTYPYLAFSVGEPVPRIWITRSRKRRDTRYYGPYAKVWELRHSLDTLLKTFPVRTCSRTVFHRAQMTGRPCLLASIGKCSAPCVGRISPEEHRHMAEQLVAVLTGRLGARHIAMLREQMQQASRDLDYERAARLRDDIATLTTVVEQNAVVLEQHVDADVFALASDELEASIHAFFVRDGSIRGERNWGVERVEDVTDGELMADFIIQVYSELMGESTAELSVHAPDEVEISRQRDAMSKTRGRAAQTATARAKESRTLAKHREQTGRSDLIAPIAPIPKEIIVPVQPARAGELETWLGSMRGAHVDIHVASRGSKRMLLERARDNAKQALQRNKMSRISDLGARTQAMNEVAEALGLDQAPLRIECFDISNTIAGAYQVASMVVFEDAVAKPSQYRRFSIRGRDGSGQADDTDALYETLTRRFKHGNIAGDSGQTIEQEHRVEQQQRLGTTRASETESGNDEPVIQQSADRHRFAYKPNLVVVDGGKPQVEAAARALTDCGIEDVAVCGLAKRLEEVWLPGQDYPIIMKRQSEGMYLLQRVRDESHRFAITYHRQTRRKGMLRSALDDIPGVGPAYQKRLLRTFGSLKAIRAASLDQLQQVDGIGESKARMIHDALHPAEPAQAVA